MTTPVTVDFWFDPRLPLHLAHLTVGGGGGHGPAPLDVRWRVMSLAVLNEGRDDDPEGDPEGYLWMPVLICAAVLRQYGQEALGTFYAALWADRGDGGAQRWINDPEVALADAQLLARRGGDVPRLRRRGARFARRGHRRPLGPHVGTPVVAVPDPGGDADARIAFFGPASSRSPGARRPAGSGTPPWWWRAPPASTNSRAHRPTRPPTCGAGRPPGTCLLIPHRHPRGRPSGSRRPHRW